MKQKTLIVTSIYSNLWGTEFGGRPSRYHHYRLSLLNMLNMKPDKVICYTSKDEIEDLKTFFYQNHLVDSEILELRLFELTDSLYFNIIKQKKNIEIMKSFDRCYEIQYNKFFWVKDLHEIHEYEKIYWFDAGLSHSGLFPDCFAYGGSYERNFQFDVFNSNFLEELNKKSDDGFILVGKNNTERYYWSVTIPEKYYENYCKDLHIIGGFFGGRPEDYLKVIEDFDDALSKLLMSESGLYMEEQILSLLYYQNPNFFNVLVFDDWYAKENHDIQTRLFYEIFLTGEDCNKNNFNIVSQDSVENEKVELKSIDELNTFNSQSSVVFASHCLNRGKVMNVKKLIESVLSNTDYDFILLTDFVNEFQEISNEKLIIVNNTEFFSDKKEIKGFPNFHITKNLLRVITKFDYDVVVYCDNDVVINEWDNNGFEKFTNQNFDISFSKNVEPQMGYLIDNFEHYRLIIDNEFGDLYDESLKDAPNPESFFFVVKNNNKLIEFLKSWEMVSEKNNFSHPTYYSGVYLGLLSLKSSMNISAMTSEIPFTKFINHQKDHNLYDFFGNKIS